MTFFELQFLTDEYLRPGHESPDVPLNSLQAVVDANLKFPIPFLLVVENTGQNIRIRLRLL